MGTTGDRGSRRGTPSARLRGWTAAAVALALASSTLAGAASASAADGYAYTWGANSDGQLGRSGTTNRPAVVSAVPRARALAGGAGHSVALSTDGTVWAWGGNFFGQLGRGTFGSLSGSSSPALVSGLSGVTAIAAGDD